MSTQNTGDPSYAWRANCATWAADADRSRRAAVPPHHWSRFACAGIALLAAGVRYAQLVSERRSE